MLVFQDCSRAFGCSHWTGKMSDSEETGIFRRPPGLGEDPAQRRRRERRSRAESATRSPTLHDASRTAVRSVRNSSLGKVRYDAKGDPVWEWRVEEPRRRQDDPTLDMLKALECEELRLVDDTGTMPSAEHGINPYDHS